MKKDVIKPIFIFLAFSFIITFLIEFLVIVPNTNSTDMTVAMMVTMFSAVVMMIPAFSVVLTRLVTREGFSNHKISFSLKNGKGKYYLLAWFLPVVLVLAGALIYFLVFPEQFDWNMSYYINQLAENGTNVTADAFRTTIISQTITGVILGPVLNCIPCFGEEWGWRGYLLPKLLKVMPLGAATVVDGVIWGLWHLPLIIAGKNYGFEYSGYPYSGIGMMVVFCVFIGIVFSYLSIKADSCIPAVLAHGAMNAVASIGIVFTSDGGLSLLGPSITGIISMIPTIITAVILMALFRHDNACAKFADCDTISEVILPGDDNLGQDKES